MITNRVGIIDYGAGNLQSLENAFQHLGANTIRLTESKYLDNFSHLVLPGVGNFGYCLKMFLDSGLSKVIKGLVLEEKVPLLGICVGMQLLADSSEESIGAQGLGWIGGEVRKIKGSKEVRVPHVGWNTVTFDESFGFIQSGEKADFYFDHSYAYHGPQHGKCIGRCLHGESFCAILRNDNIVATQFHPEKSQDAGLRFLKCYLQM